MQDMNHSYFIYYAYQQEVKKKIKNNLDRIISLYCVEQGQQFQISCESMISRSYIKENKFVPQVETNYFVVEWNLKASFCISLAQLVELIFARVITIKQTQFFEILQQILIKLAELENPIQTEIDSANCWIILDQQSSKFGKLLSDQTFKALIIPADGSLLLNPPEKNQNYTQKYDLQTQIPNIIKYCNNRLSKLFYGLFRFENKFLYFDPKNKETPSQQNQFNDQYDEFKQNIKSQRILTQTTQTIFDQQLCNIKFQRYIINKNTQNTQNTDRQIKFFDRIVQIVEFLQIFLNPEVISQIQDGLMKQFKIEQCFNVDSYQSQFFNRDEDTENKEIEIFIIIHLVDKIKTYENLRYEIIQSFGKRAIDLFRPHYNETSSSPIAITKLQEFQKINKLVFDQAFQADLYNIFNRNSELFQTSQNNFHRFCKYFYETFLPKNQNSSRYLAFDFEQFQCHINDKKTVIQNYLCKVKTYYSEKEIIEKILYAQTAAFSKSFSQALSNKIFEHASRSTLSENMAVQIKTNLSLIQLTIDAYIKYVESRYNEKLKNNPTFQRISGEKHNQVLQKWQDLTLKKQDLIEILTLKYDYCKIIIRDYFEQHMKDIIDDAYKQELTEAFNKAQI